MKMLSKKIIAMVFFCSCGLLYAHDMNIRFSLQSWLHIWGSPFYELCGLMSHYGKKWWEQVSLNGQIKASLKELKKSEKKLEILRQENLVRRKKEEECATENALMRDNQREQLFGLIELTDNNFSVINIFFKALAGQQKKSEEELAAFKEQVIVDLAALKKQVLSLMEKKCDGFCNDIASAEQRVKDMKQRNDDNNIAIIASIHAIQTKLQATPETKLAADNSPSTHPTFIGSCLAALTGKKTSSEN